MTRPDVIILPEGATVPPTNLIAPPPNQFTHQVTGAQPFYYSEKMPGASPSGQFEPGTKINVLVYDGGAMCRAVDARGLYVLTEWKGLQRIKVD